MVYAQQIPWLLVLRWYVLCEVRVETESTVFCASLANSPDGCVLFTLGALWALNQLIVSNGIKLEETFDQMLN